MPAVGVKRKTAVERAEIGDHVLYFGDCFDLIPQIEEFDAVVTDPPYGIGANRMTLGNGKKEYMRGVDMDWDSERPDLTPLLELGVPTCIWGGNYFTDVLPPTNDWLVWFKRMANVSFSECELAWTNFGKRTRHLAHAWGGEYKYHPTMKPVPVMRFCLSFLPKECTVLDPFMGACSTGLACAETGRKFIGIEKDRKFFEVSCRRLRRELRLPEPGTEPVKAKGGRSLFDRA